MKFKVIQGEKGKSRKPEKEQKQGKQDQRNAMEDYYAKERPRAQEMEQAEGDEDIVDTALKNQYKPGDAA
jgi:hypothetical protein